MDREIPSNERRRARRKKIITAAVFAVAAIGTIAAIGSMMRKSVNSADLTVGTADTGTIEVTVSGTGTVCAAFEEIITSPISSRIIDVFCRAGDSVKAGTPLLLLDLQTTENEVSELNDQISMKAHELEQQRVSADTRVADLEMQAKVKEMTLGRLEAELRNERYLDSIGSGTGDRVRQAELAVATGRLELDQLRQQLANEKRIAKASEDAKHLDIDIARRNLGERSRTLSDARVCSPRNATLTFIADQIGETVAEGQKIAVIADLGHFRVDGEIADSYAGKVSVGSKVTVKIGKERIGGTISNLTPQSQGGVMKFTVRLDDDAHPRLRSGLKTDVYVACNVIDEAVRIPNGPYYTGPGTYELFFMTPDGKQLEKREVKLGDANFEYVEALGGVSPGDRLILGDMAQYKDNATLRVR